MKSWTYQNSLEKFPFGSRAENKAISPKNLKCLETDIFDVISTSVMPSVTYCARKMFVINSYNLSTIYVSLNNFNFP